MLWVCLLLGGGRTQIIVRYTKKTLRKLPQSASRSTAQRRTQELTSWGSPAGFRKFRVLGSALGAEGLRLGSWGFGGDTIVPIIQSRITISCWE